MRYLILVFTYFLSGALLSIPLLAQPEVSMKTLVFQDQNGSYLEAQFFFPGSSLTAKSMDSTTTRSKIKNTVLVKKGEEIVNFEKYTLTGPKTEHSVDIQDILRFRVPEGRLVVQSTVEDVYGNSKSSVTADTINSDFSQSELILSNIALYSSMRKAKSGDSEKFVRSGYYAEPLTHNYYHQNLDELNSYVEVYGADRAFDGHYALSYTLLQKGKKDSIIKQKYKRMTPGNRDAVFLRMDLSDVSSGTYTYRVAVIDRNKKVHERRTIEFYRSKPSLDQNEDFEKQSYEQSFVQNMSSDELDYSLKAIAMKIDQSDIQRFNNIISRGSSDSKRSFLYNFWYRINQETPQKTYDAYMEVARALDRKYNTGFGHGFESDRGWIYLKYGQPDDKIAVEDDPSAPPYEIWTYYQLSGTSQKNVKFVFYDPDLTNNFDLLHSTARGEISNPQWLHELYEDAPEQIEGENFLNSNTVEDNWNRHAEDYFNDN